METVNQAAGNGVSRTGLAGAKAAQTGVVPVQTAWRELDGSGEEEKAGEILNLGERSVPGNDRGERRSFLYSGFCKRE